MKLKFFYASLICAILYVAGAGAQTLQNGAIWQRYFFAGSLSVGKNMASTVNPASYAPASAWLEVGKDSTTRGMIIPRVVATSVISAPVPGLIVFSYVEGYKGYTPSGWVSLSGGTGGGANNYPISFTYDSVSEAFTLGRAGLTSLTVPFANLYPKLRGSYANPPWITSLAYSKLIGLPSTLAGYGITDAASSGHTHAYSTLTGIPGTFAPSAHTHGMADLSGFNIVSPSNGSVLKYNSTSGKWEVGSDNVGGGGGGGDMFKATYDVANNGIVDNAEALNGQAASYYLNMANHTGSLAWSVITGRPTTLAGYGITDPVVLTSNTYTNPPWLTSLAYGKITGTPTTLAGYGITDAASSGHTHAYSSLTGIPSTFAPSAHSHAESEVTNLVTDLAAKVAGNTAITGATKTKVSYDSKGLVTAGADAGIADITGLQAALNGKLNLTDTGAHWVSRIFRIPGRDSLYFQVGSNIYAIRDSVGGGSGSGISGLTANYIPKASSGTAIGNSQIYDDGTGVGIGTATPASKLDVIGAIRANPTGFGPMFLGANSTAPSYNVLSLNGVMSDAGLTGVIAEASGGSGDLNLYLQAQGKIHLRTNGSNYSAQVTTSGQLGVGLSTGSPDASALVDFTSTTRGLLPPRMSTTQRNAISSPAEGLTVYDVTMHKNYVWDGSAWQTSGSVTGSIALKLDSVRKKASTDSVFEYRNGTPVYAYRDSVRLLETIIVEISDETTALTTGTGKRTFRMPWPGTIYNIRASLTTAGTGLSTIFNVKKNGTTIFSTNLSIDIGATTSVGATTPYVFSTTSFANNDVVSIDLTQAGVNAAGGKLYFDFIRQ